MSQSNELNDCGCCEDTIPEPALYNPPGQKVLDYRISVHSSFLERMIARLSSEALPDGDYAGERPLRDLTTRAEDDFAMGLLDAMAVIGDVLTFYQERIANEGFLRTATERRSVLAMARAIGYELNLGVAAETDLAFTVDATAGSPDIADIPAGTQVQSIPQEQDELPQTFETLQDFTADVAWNELRPQLTESQLVTFASQQIYLAGTGLNLTPGDRMLLVGFVSDEPVDFRRKRIRTVDEDMVEGRTLVKFESDSGAGMSAGSTIGVYVFREKLAIFGHNAPHFNTLSSDATAVFNNWDTPDWDIWEDSILGPVWYEEADLFLERAVDKIVEESWLLLERPGDHQVYRIREVLDLSKTGFAISAKVTGLELDDIVGNELGDNPTDKDENFKVRTTTAYVVSEVLTLAPRPLSDVLAAETNQIILGQSVTGLRSGQFMVISGENPDGVSVSEIVELQDATVEPNATTLQFKSALKNIYVRDTAVLNGNVVRAGHGETVSDEALGGGDGARPHQRFTLKKPPLTHVSAETPSGSESALTVRVNDVAWVQVSSLYGLQVDAKAYIVRIDDDANASVIFGDGKMGTRLPTGQENVKATYRSGIGQDGEVGAETLTLLKVRPFGIQGVTNPLPADGAEDPETLEGARDNAPLTVRTLDRIVSLRDYEDFARAFAGIGKAQAVSIWDGTRELVHIAVADPTGEPVPDTTLDKLSAAIEAARDPLREFCLGTFEKTAFNLQAKVLVDPAYLRVEVESAIRQALREAFTFEMRAFGQPVSSAEVITIIQTVAGVLAVDLDKLYIDGKFSRLHAVLAARSATYDETAGHDSVCGRILPAQLLLINLQGITLLEMMP